MCTLPRWLAAAVVAGAVFVAMIAGQGVTAQAAEAGDSDCPLSPTEIAQVFKDSGETYQFTVTENDTDPDNDFSFILKEVTDYTAYGIDGDIISTEAASGLSYEIYEYDADSETYVSTGESGETGSDGSFTLADNQQALFTVASGSTWTVQQPDPEGWKLTAMVGTDGYTKKINSNTTEIFPAGTLQYFITAESTYSDTELAGGDAIAKDKLTVWYYDITGVKRQLDSDDFGIDKNVAVKGDNDVNVTYKKATTDVSIYADTEVVAVMCDNIESSEAAPASAGGIATVADTPTYDYTLIFMRCTEEEIEEIADAVSENTTKVEDGNSTTPVENPEVTITDHYDETRYPVAYYTGFYTEVAHNEGYDDTSKEESSAFQQHYVISDIPWGMSGNSGDYTSESGDDNYQYVTSTAVEDEIHPYSIAYWFANMAELESADLGKMDVSYTAYFGFAFFQCHKLSNVTLPDDGWNVTSTAVDLQRLFYACIALPDTTLNNGFKLANWDTSNVTSMSRTFYGRSKTGSAVDGYAKWNELDVAGWDTSSVTDMRGMFNYCESLKSFGPDGTTDLNGWDVSNVTTIAYMFCYTPLDSLDVSKWDTSSVENMQDLFDDCTELTSLSDLSGWDLSSVTVMEYMFYKVPLNDFYAIGINNWDTSNVEDMEGIFESCTNVTSLDLSGWDTSSATDMTELFCGCTSLETLDLSGWDTSEVTEMKEMFENCSKLTGSMVISSTTCTTYTSMFSGCSTETVNETHASFTLYYTSDDGVQALAELMVATATTSSDYVTAQPISDMTATTVLIMDEEAFDDADIVAEDALTESTDTTGETATDSSDTLDDISADTGVSEDEDAETEDGDTGESGEDAAGESSDTADENATGGADDGSVDTAED